MKRNNFDKLIHPYALEELIYLEANKNNTNLCFSDGKKVSSGYNLKQFETILKSEANFKRVHRSYIVNFDFIDRVNEDFYFLTMKNEEVLPISMPEVFKEVEVTA